MGVNETTEPKDLIWIGRTKKVISNFPIEVKRIIGHALYFAQAGARHSRTKMMKGLGCGVYEVIEDHRGDTYRAVYTVKFEKNVYVLHAFQKKSKSGIKTPKEIINTITKRLKQVREKENG